MSSCYYAARLEHQTLLRQYKDIHELEGHSEER